MGCVLVLLSDLLIAPALFASIIGYKTDVIFRRGENRTLNQVCSLYSVAGGVRCFLSILHFGEGRKVLKERFRTPPTPPHLEVTTMAPCLVPYPECPEARWTAEQHQGQAKERAVSAVALYFTQSFPVSVILESTVSEASCWRILPCPLLNSSRQMRPHHVWYTVVLWRLKHLLVDEFCTCSGSQSVRLCRPSFYSVLHKVKIASRCFKPSKLIFQSESCSRVLQRAH